MIRNASLPRVAALALVLLPSISLAKPLAKHAPWDAEQVAELAAQLVEQAQGLSAELDAAAAKLEDAESDRDRATGVGHRNVVIQDLSILERRSKSYRSAVDGGQGVEQTRRLFGRIEALIDLTASDMRALPDYATYSGRLEALEATLAQLGRFYAEHLEVHTPPDPLKSGNP